MIITRQKDFDYLLKLICNKSVFIAGCSECATICHTGGEEEVKTLKEKLRDNNIKVTGTVVLDPACHLNNDKRIFRKHSAEIDKSEIILVLACGNGVQTVSEIFDDKMIISGTDTLFLGEIKRANHFEKRCNMCGDCLVESFGGICPVSRCPKGMLNGPCGGVNNGKCEIDNEMNCVWYEIIEKLKKKGDVSRLKEICQPKKWSNSIERERHI